MKRDLDILDGQLPAKVQRLDTQGLQDHANGQDLGQDKPVALSGARTYSKDEYEGQEAPTPHDAEAGELAVKNEPLTITGDPNVQLTMNMHVKREWASAIIGRKGDTIRSIRRNARCMIQVNDPRPGQQLQTIAIYGTLDRIYSAFNEIHQLVTDLQDPDYQVVESFEPLVAISVVPEMVGTIIGRGGQHVKQINRVTGAQIKVQSLKEGEREQIVQLFGSGDQVHQAVGYALDYLSRFEPRKQGIRGPISTGLPSKSPAAPQLMGPKTQGRGRAVVVNQAQPPQQAQQPILLSSNGLSGGGQQVFMVNQAGMQGQQVPHVLIMQPDGTYTTAQVVVQHSGGQIAQPAQVAQVQTQASPTLQPVYGVQTSPQISAGGIGGALGGQPGLQQLQFSGGLPLQVPNLQSFQGVSIPQVSGAQYIQAGRPNFANVQQLQPALQPVQQQPQQPQPPSFTTSQPIGIAYQPQLQQNPMQQLPQNLR